MKKKKILLKFISLVLSFTLWFYVISSKPVSMTKSVEIILDLPHKYALVNQIPHQVNLHLRGPRLFLNEIDHNSKIVYKIEKDAILKHKKKIKLILEKGEINLPLGIEIIKTEPKILNLKFGKKVRKWLKPKLEISEDDREKYNIKKIIFNHKKILVDGPYQLLKNKSKFLFGDISFDFIEPNQWFHPVTVDKQQYSVMTKDLKLKIDFGPHGSNKKFKKIKIYYFSSEQNFKSNTHYADVEVFQTKLTDSFTEKDIKIYTEIPDNAKEKIILKLKAKLPEGVHLVKINPKQIEVFIKKNKKD